MTDITTPGERKPSAACTDYVKATEKLRLTAYMPTPNDVPTIGYGSTGPGIKHGMTWTKEQAEERFARDIATYSAGVDRALGTVLTTQGQFDAMVSFAYNVGVPKFSTSTLLKLHRARAYGAAAEQFARWNKQKGKVLRGLTIRRAAEAAMYRGAA